MFYKNTVGIVFGTFAPLHQGHLDLILRAKKECELGCIVISCGNDGDRGEPLMPQKERFDLICEFFRRDPFIQVISINDSRIGAEPYPRGWKTWMNYFFTQYKNFPQFENAKRLWYVGDKNYQDDLREMYDEDSTLFDRTLNPISATKIRSNPVRYWNYITAPFRKFFTYPILICGSASEGKTELTNDLARYFNAPWATEYARTYIGKNNIQEQTMKKEDFLNILYWQNRWNKNCLICAEETDGLCFWDSNAFTTMMFAKYYSEDEECALTQKDYQDILEEYKQMKFAVPAEIYVTFPHGVYVDDGERYMEHSDVGIRLVMYHYLMEFIKDAGLIDRTHVLEGDYYMNFKTIKGHINDMYLGDVQ